jgi:hypothetical protein
MNPILANELLLPTSQTFAGYEKLGIVGILLVVLFVGLLMSNRIFGWIKEFGGNVLTQLGKQTVALENVKQSNASMEIGQLRMHERMDMLLRCPAHPCPLRPTDHVALARYAAPVPIVQNQEIKPQSE